MFEDDIEKRTWARTQKSYGPDWGAAIEFGIDVALIEHMLSLSVEERFIESLEMTRLAHEFDKARELLNGSAK